MKVTVKKVQQYRRVEFECFLDTKGKVMYGFIAQMVVLTAADVARRLRLTAASLLQFELAPTKSPHVNLQRQI